MRPFIEDGGPAFPRPSSIDHTDGDLFDGNRTVPEQGGMSVRDYFAAAALQGMLATWTPEQVFDPAVTARVAYRLADALVAAREGGAG